MPRKITTLPKGDQCVPISTVDRPVTQIVETAVNSASKYLVGVPSAEEIGSVSNNDHKKMIEVNTSTANRLGEAELILEIAWRQR